MEISGKYLNDITTMINVFATVYTAINKCENTDLGKEADELTKKAEEISKQIQEEIVQLNISQHNSK